MLLLLLLRQTRLALRRLQPSDRPSTQMQQGDGGPFSLAHLKGRSKLACRRVGGLDLRLLDLRLRRAYLGQPPAQLLDGSSRAICLPDDRALRCVHAPAAQAEARALLLRVLPEENALHLAVDNELDADRILGNHIKIARAVVLAIQLRNSMNENMK